jgi:hypothetical protein
VEYILNDTATNGPAAIIDNQKFWKKDLFQDVVDGSPVYINLKDNFDSKDYQDKRAVTKTNSSNNYSANFSETVIIFSDDNLADFTISRIAYGSDGKFYFTGDVIFSMDLSSYQYMEYITTFPTGAVPYEAVSFTDRAGNIYTHVISDNKRDGSTCSYKAEILDKAKKPSNVTLETN